MTGPHCAAFWEGGVRGISFVRAPFVPPSLRGQNVSGLAHAVYTANPPRKTHTVYSCTYGLHVSYMEVCVCVQVDWAPTLLTLAGVPLSALVGLCTHTRLSP